ncbi:hypothetical protein OAN10_01585 [Alphaproteobacteria bacterium]|nr:hypothetical protein [Alphaproteobacteria bacterium]
MNKKLFAFTINTLEEAESVILASKSFKIKPILYFKKYFLLGFGAEFILTFRKMLITRFGKSNFKLFIDCGSDQSLAIKMANEKIDYLKLKSNSIILSKIKNIAFKNRVLLNPSFNIVDCRNRKNISLKLKKLYSKEEK